MIGYRNTDPAESSLAYHNFRASGDLALRKRQVAWCVMINPGCTSAEYSHVMHSAFPDLPIRSAVESPHKRLPELEMIGYIKRGEVRECRDTGNQAVTWWPVEDK